jgi:hypothetical protein
VHGGSGDGEDGEDLINGAKRGAVTVTAPLFQPS